jgi:hypothetical protein
MVTPAVDGIDLFKIAGRSISGWIPSLKTGITVRQPFCSQLEERLLMWLEYHPQVVSYARGDIGPAFASAYRLPLPQHAPFAIGYAFESKPHQYLPDVVGTLTNGQPFIAEAGMEDDKRGDRNQARAEAARRLARFQQGTFWIGTERTLTKRRHYNLVTRRMPDARRFPPLATLSRPSPRSGLGEKWPRSQRWRADFHTSFPSIWWKQRSGRWWEMARRRDICWSIWSSSRFLVLFPWPCSHLMLHLLCPHHSQSRSYLNRYKKRQPSHASRSPSFQVRRLMPRRFQSHNESNFTAICGPFRKCWPGPPKPALPKRRASPVRRFRGW